MLYTQALPSIPFQRRENGKAIHCVIDERSNFPAYKATPRKKKKKK
jgi:hypothetical protein